MKPQEIPHLKLVKSVSLIVAIVGLLMLLLTAVNAWYLWQWRKGNLEGIELSKADCIETCIRILQTEQLFPDYHRTVQKCNDLFAEVENCRLAK